jgi:hypothetical protein
VPWQASRVTAKAARRCSLAWTRARAGARAALPVAGSRVEAANQGLTLAHFRAQLEDLRDTSLTLQLNLSTFRPHPRVISGYKGGGSELELSRKGQGKLELSGNGNECKPMPPAPRG